MGIIMVSYIKIIYNEYIEFENGVLKIFGLNRGEQTGWRKLRRFTIRTFTRYEGDQMQKDRMGWGLIQERGMKRWISFDEKT
jgi:hypothetical protein